MVLLDEDGLTLLAEEPLDPEDEEDDDFEEDDEELLDWLLLLEGELEDELGLLDEEDEDDDLELLLELDELDEDDEDELEDEELLLLGPGGVGGTYGEPPQKSGHL